MFSAELEYSWQHLLNQSPPIVLEISSRAAANASAPRKKAGNKAEAKMGRKCFGTKLQMFARNSLKHLK